MKPLLTLLIVLLSLNSSAQTDIIAARSHGASSLMTLDESDNFGLPSKQLDSIIYIGKCCIVQVSSHFDTHFYHDTICDHPLFIENNFSEKKLKKLYSSSVVFVGFKDSEKRRLDENSIPWFLAPLALSYLAYLVYAMLSKKTT
ncbi:MAG: hypothetical protein ACI837_000100 [Crocinitomicaceae bacterium]|jgi:hypothetical protein